MALRILAKARGTGAAIDYWAIVACIDRVENGIKKVQLQIGGYVSEDGKKIDGYAPCDVFAVDVDGSDYTKWFMEDIINTETEKSYFEGLTPRDAMYTAAYLAMKTQTIPGGPDFTQATDC